MARIPNDVLQEIKESVDIVEVIEQYVQLTKRGQNYVASCPFHEDQNPSFSVHSGKQIYKCFSCGRGGNVFSFLQEIESIHFMEAVQKVAEFANITLADQYLSDFSQRKNANQPLYDLHNKATEFFAFYLKETKNGEDALAYLTERQYTTELIDQFQLGLAPDNSDTLAQILLNDDFKHEDLIASGLFYQNNQGHLISRFRGRLMIPLQDRQGRVVGFSGRILPRTALENHDAKYLNSPETPIFHKSNLLYNFYQARPSIRQKNQVLIAEGYMDVMALAKAGFSHVVASMGTSLTKDHMQQVENIANEIIFVFDGDEAGQNAIAKAFEDFSNLSQSSLKAIQIPNNMDPDEYLKNFGPQAFQKLLNQAVTAFEFFREHLKQRYDLKDAHQLSLYIEALIQLISALDSAVEQQLRIQELVGTYQLDQAFIEEQIARQRQLLRQKQQANQASSSQSRQENSAPAPAYYPTAIEATPFEIISQRAYQSEKIFLAYLIEYEAAWNFIEHTKEPIILFHAFAQKAYFALQDYYYDLGYQVPLADVASNHPDSQLSSFMTTVIWEGNTLGYDDQIMIDCLNVIKEEFIQQEIKELQQQLEVLEKNQEYQKVDETMMKLIQLNYQLKHN